MAIVNKSRQYSAGDILTAAYYNADRDEIIAGVNSVVDSQIAIDANIDLTKLASGTLPSDIVVNEANFPTAVTLDGVQTLTNKTLVKPFVNGSYGSFTINPDNFVVTFDLATSNVHTVTLEGNRTLAVTNDSVGQSFMVRIIQDPTGSRTVTWWGNIKWTGGNAPTLSVTANSIDVFGFIVTDTGKYDGYYVSFDLR